MMKIYACKSSKILSFIIAICLVLSVMPMMMFGASAVEADDVGEQTTVEEQKNETEASGSEEIEVQVNGDADEKSFETMIVGVTNLNTANNKATYTVTYKNSSGSSASKSMTNGSKVIIDTVGGTWTYSKTSFIGSTAITVDGNIDISNPVKTGYTFIGWTLKNVDGNTISLTATWNDNSAKPVENTSKKTENFEEKVVTEKTTRAEKIKETQTTKKVADNPETGDADVAWAWITMTVSAVIVGYAVVQVIRKKKLNSQTAE